MESLEAVVGIFPNHAATEAAVQSLNISGFDLNHLSVIGQGYHAEEQVMGFYGRRSRMHFRGSGDSFWRDPWDLFVGGVALTVPAVGPVIALGYLAAAIAATTQSAAVAGGVSAVGAALQELGMSKDSVRHYETVLKAGSFLVITHGASARIALAKSIFKETDVSQVDVHATMAMSRNPLPQPEQPVHMIEINTGSKSG